MNYLPKISVIIPCYNSASYILEAIDSVMLQFYKNIELIVIDDGSTDKTKEILETLNINFHYYIIPHSGAASARNYGVQKSTGDYLAFLDSDDVWPLNKLQKQLDIILSKKIDATFTGIVQFIDQSFSNLRLKSPDEKMPGICASTLLIKRQIFLDIGYFKTGYAIGEFIEWFMRAKQAGVQFEVLDDITTLRRIHGNNTSLKYKLEKKDYLKALYDGLKNNGLVYEKT